MLAPHHARTAVAALLGGLFVAASAHADFGTDACLAQKARAWGTRRACERTEESKALAGRPADAAKCRTRFDRTMQGLDARATAAVIACRFRDNGDNTITDFATGLMWAKLRSHDGVASADWLDADNRYDWKTALEVAAVLNGWGAASPTPLIPISGSGGWSDWRVPNFVELTTIKNPSQPGCSAAETVACIDPIFGPTIPWGYWTTTTHDPDFTWWVHFGDPTLVGLSVREVLLSVRPVRTAF